MFPVGSNFISLLKPSIGEIQFFGFFTIRLLLSPGESFYVYKKRVSMYFIPSKA
jgi:hypothetical protein